MRKLISIAVFSVTLLAFSPVFAAEHAYVRAIQNDLPAENIYRINIEKIDGSEKEMGANKRVSPGKHSLDLSLGFNPKWAPGMDRTIDHIYYKTIEMEFEAGKTYYLGAKVDPNASVDAMKAGSFWEPVVVKVE